MDYLAHIIVGIAALWLSWQAARKWRAARYAKGAACGSCPSCGPDEGNGHHRARVEGAVDAARTGSGSGKG